MGIEIIRESEVPLRPVPPPITLTHVDELIRKCNDTKGVVNDKFISALYRRISRMVYERAIQALPSFSIDEIRIMIHTAFCAATLHHGKERKKKGGGSVWEGHLDDAAGELVEKMARTRPSVVAATYGHDIHEDTHVKDLSTFLDNLLITFKDSADPLIKKLEPVCRRIWDLIESVTKEPKSTRSETRDATLRKLFAKLIRLGPDVIFLKFADRLSNLKTLDVHTEEKQKEIADETYEVYCRLGDIFGMHEFVRAAVDLCMQVTNKNLLSDFQRLRDERIAARLDNKKVKLKRAGDAEQEISVRECLNEIFNPNGKPEKQRELLEKINIRIVPKSLSDFVLKTDKPLASLSISDIGISSLAPLFEIPVIVRPGISVTDVRDYLMKTCWKAPERYEFIDLDREQLPQRGALLAIYSHRLGILRFRINDEVSEARSRRGIMAPSSGQPSERDSNPLPPRVHKSLHRVLQESALEPGSTMRTAKELLLHPTITVYTKANQPIELTAGATPLDLAQAIHPDLLISLLAAKWHKPSKDDPSETEEVEISIFEPLKHSMQVELIADTSSKQRGTSTIVGDPRRLLFCQRPSATDLRNKGYRRRGPDGSSQPIIERGKKYTQDIARLFGIMEEEVLLEINQALAKKAGEDTGRMQRVRAERDRRRQERKTPVTGSAVMHQAAAGTLQISSQPTQLSQDEMYEKIGNGDIEPISILSQGRFKDREIWKIRVQLEHSPHILEQFMARFKKDINADRILQIPAPPPNRQAVRIDLMDMGDSDGSRSSFEMMKMLLILSEKYDLSVEHQKWGKRAALKVRDLWSLVLYSFFRKKEHPRRPSEHSRRVV